MLNVIGISLHTSKETISKVFGLYISYWTYVADKLESFKSILIIIKSSSSLICSWLLNKLSQSPKSTDDISGKSLFFCSSIVDNWKIALSFFIIWLVCSSIEVFKKLYISFISPVPMFPSSLRQNFSSPRKEYPYLQVIHFLLFPFTHKEHNSSHDLVNLSSNFILYQK